MTTMDHVQNQLVAYLNGELESRSAEEVRVHLKSCGTCSGELESLKSVWNFLGQMPEERPSPALQTRFYAALEAYESALQGKQPLPEKSPRPWSTWVLPKQFAVQFAMVTVLFVIGGMAGYFMRGEKADNGQIGQLREEVRSVSRPAQIARARNKPAVYHFRSFPIRTALNRSTGAKSSVSSSFVFSRITQTN